MDPSNKFSPISIIELFIKTTSELDLFQGTDNGWTIVWA
jgi:hypothetical protein